MAYDSQIFNTDPYYDDYDPSKKFLRMMFRPGYAVQARELTQLQTIIQNQIQRFGNNIFTDGSMVVDGQISQNYVRYARVTGMTGTSSIKDFIGTETNSVGFAPARIVHAETGLSSGDTNSVLFFEYISGATAFSVGTVVGATAYNNARISATITGNFTISGRTANALGTAIVVSANEGVRYVDGFFVLHDAQSIAACSITGATTSSVRIFDDPTCSVGFLKNKQFVSAQTDTSLNDPAYGYYNYAAPGSDRFKIDLNISRYNFDPTTVGTTSGAANNYTRQNYLEIMQVVNGYATKIDSYPDYSIIEDTLARRTFDESGNYTVNKFDLNLTTGSTANALNAVIGSGKAYIFGQEFERVSPTTLSIPCARDTYLQPNIQFNSILGSFVGGTPGNNTNLTGFDLSTMPIVLLSSSTGSAPLTQIGTARARGEERTTPTNTNLYLFDVSMSSGSLFSSAKTVFVPGVVGAGQQFFNIAQTNNATVLQGNNDSLLWSIPSGMAAKTINDVQYSFTTHFTPVVCAGASANIKLTNKTGLYVVNQTSFPTAAVATSFPTNVVRLYGMSGQELSGTYVSNASGMTFSLSPSYTGNAYAQISTEASYALGYKKRTKTFTTEVMTITGGASYPWQTFRTDMGSQPYFFLSNAQNSPKIDIIRVVSVTGTYAGVANTNLNSYFTLDTGQRDAYYDWSRLVLAQGATADSTTGITGPFTITVERFVHSSDFGLFTVDSYITGGSFGYENIPSYTSPKTGIVYKLRDVIDFRPGRIGSIPDATASVTGSFYPSLMSIPSGANKFSYTHHLPRTDKIILSRNKQFSVISGVSDAAASVPQDNPDAMTLYTVTLNPYTFSETDASYRYNNNRRYTMKDVANLEKRLDSVQYYTTLNILEQEAKNLQILDAATNLTVPKKGILVDSFRGHNVGDIQDESYNASIDYETTVLRPAFINRVYRLGITAGSNTTINGSSGVTADYTATISYTLSPQIVQPVATKSLTVNPIGVSNYLGTLQTYPSSDFWYNDIKDPIVRININGENDNWESICARSSTGSAKNGGFGTQYNDWESNWSGVPISNETNTFLSNKIPSRNITAKSSGINVANSNLSMLPESLRSSGDSGFENKIVRSDILPYARNIVVAISAEGLKPNTTMYGFLDGRGLSASGTLYEMDASGVLGTTVSSMTTNSVGKLIPASGGFYAFKLNPNNDPLITVGSKLLRVTDSISNNIATTTTAADQMFYIEGTYGTNSNDISSTRKPKIIRESVSSENIITSIFSRENQRYGLTQLKGAVDPLSQSFSVNSALYPSGIMIKQIGLFFKNKSTKNVPITLVIKPTINDYPHPSKILPFATATLYPSSVNTSVNGDSGIDPETKFVFTSPVFLLPGKTYAFSVMTNSLEYEIFTAVPGDTVLSNTNTAIASKQPNVLSMFKAQSFSNIVKIDNEDVKFILYACDFSSAMSGTVGVESGLDTSLVYGTNISIDELRMNVPFITPPGTVLTFTETSPTLLSSGNIPNENTIVLPVRKTLITPNVTKFFKATANLSTTNRWVSPILDLDRGSVYAIENIVTATPSTETSQYSNNSNSRYITKRINLEQNATDIRVYLSLSNPYPSTVDVYYRYLPASSANTSIFDNQGYVLMTKTAGSDDYTSTNNTYREANYSATGNAPFNIFSVKIVFKSSDGTIIPKIQNMRIVAT